MDLLQLVTDTLKTIGVPTLYGWYDADLGVTHITFLEFDNLEGEYADDENTSEEHYITVDLWTFDANESLNLNKQVKSLLKQNNFMYQDGTTQTEPQTDGSILYHVTTRWLIIEILD